MRKVEVSPYNSDWIKLFESEAEKIKLIFGRDLLAIHHIGSTAVEGLSAKPVIDIMPIVHNVYRVDAHNEAMISLGYEPKGENGIRGRRYFQKGGNDRTHHIHIYQEGSIDIARHIAFRDYLRNHPKIKELYGELKMQLASIYPYDIDAYIKGKEPLVKQIEQKALQWTNLTTG
ncbi:GrpB family protein [Cytobacillus gottheilii]|uniref:GrpB family protein n=1 Tax=Cytobacillus gottheilii TaxID=859144 RepID=A0ABX8FC15_9BACI|nr:GrpB family protein [Cytobacillus gottheilii]QVY61759.1 GrpB family protein [Cytobacillus gottheilii]